MCESRGGRPGLPVPNSPYGLCGLKAALNLKSPRAQELCESRGGCPEFPVSDSPCGLCGRRATLNLKSPRVQELCESRGGRPGLPVPNKPDGFGGRKTTLKRLGLTSLIVLVVSAVDVKQHRNEGSKHNCFRQRRRQEQRDRGHHGSIHTIKGYRS